ncbi:hypothetical protein PG994_015336 [Apiospora phragmitis]|uniref:Uncharacterized protein n=1 Tax=Apiospora phragmitis TaxID=2905665 RepID=A0ABR1SR82_9PEZI
MSDRVAGGAMAVDRHHHTSVGVTLKPSFFGYINSTMDALILFEACLTSHISHVPRRPRDQERASLIRSGNVFIYQEHSSGIKRWTDGVPWSPSRLLGNFLLYRELDKPFQPGEKKKAMKKDSKGTNRVSKPATDSRANSVGFSSINMGALASQYSDVSSNNKDAERALVGSLVDSYKFKSDGLVKKTISVKYNEMQYHLISYYNIEDVVQEKLRTPLESPGLHRITPRAALISDGSFRAPVEPIMDDRVGVLIAQGHIPPDMAYGSSQAMFVPNVHHGHQTGWATGYPMQVNLYAVNPHTLPPLPVAFSHPPSGYSYEASRLPAKPPNFPSMQIHSRQHSTIANNGYESGHNSYGPMSSLSMSHMNSTPVVPSSVMTSSGLLDSHEMSHGPFSAQSIYGSPAASVASSQYWVMCDSSARHVPSYNNSTFQLQTPSYNTQANPMFDSANRAQVAGDYKSTLQSQ